MAGAVLLTNFVGSMAPAAPAAPASAAGFAPIPAWAAIMIGDIIMLTGIIPTWATVDSDEIGREEANDDTSATAGPTIPVTAVPAEEANPTACVATPASGVAKFAKPARLNGTALNDGNAAATPIAPP